MSATYVKKHRYAQHEGPIVPAPSINVFTPAISAKNIPSALGTRAGSNDHLNWNSPFGKKAA